jgi:hypothetical protein
MTVAHQKPHLEIRLEPATYITSRTCFFCGADTAKDSFIAAVYEDGEFTGAVVCPGYPLHPGCLSVAPEVLAERLRNRATRARIHANEFANELEALAANLPMMPTHQDWRTARDAYVRKYWPEFLTDSDNQPVNEDGLVF